MVDISKALKFVRSLPPAENSRLTQIATTGPSYRKALSHLERAGIEGRAIDYGAGRGHGLREIGADTFEPYPQGWSPTYTKPEEIPDEVYRRLVNLNVLNVLDPQARESAVLNMGRIVEPGGGGVISTRGRDVMSARGEPGPEPMSLIIGEGDQARYQKGFTPRELREYVGDTLGSRFDVEPSDVGQASIMFRRNREDGGAVDYNDAPNYALDAETSRFNMGDVFAPLNRSLSQGKNPARAENIPLARPVAPPEPDVVNRALGVVRAEPRPMDIKVSRQAPPPPRPVPRPAPRPAPAPAAAAPDASESRRLWDIYNETGNPADFVRASNAMRAGRADGGEVREGYAGGGKPLQQALEAAARYIRPRSPEQAAVDVAGLLRAAREKEVTDSLLEQADPRALLELYAAGRTGADMPMDYASRMGRAADQGFNKLIYRGTQGREALNRSLQTDRLEEGSKTFGTGSWASSDPDVAGTYSGLSEFSPVTMPLMVRGSELREVPWGGGLWSEGPGGQTTDRVARAAREEGAKGLTFSNITDIGPHLWNRADTQKRLPDTSDTTVIFDPSIVRSPFARFDPRLEHLLDLNRKDGGRAVDVARETLLEDEYPTHYLPNVGRQVMADGGTPDDDIRRYEARMADIARQPEDIRSMTHAPSRPMRPVQIEGGLIGKRTLGEAPYDVAGPLSGIAQTAYSLKTLPFYFTPAAPLAAAADFGEAAIDTAKAAREGDYLGAGITGALGVAMPGYAYRKPIGDVVGRALNAIRGNPAAVGAGAAGAAVMTPEEAEAIVPVSVARNLLTRGALPKSSAFDAAVGNTPSARIEDGRLLLSLIRGQQPGQAGQPSTRGGVFYLPEGSKDVRHYRGGTGTFYGGPSPIMGESAFSNPLFVKGATGGKAPEAAYDELMGKKAYQAMRNEAMSSMPPYYLKDPELREEMIGRFLEKYAPSMVGQEQNILRNSTRGNQLAYALQESAVGDAVRRAGYDSVLGYSTSRATKQPFISEVFDVRERSYPTSGGGYDIWPEYLSPEDRAVGLARELALSPRKAEVP